MPATYAATLTTTCPSSIGKLMELLVTYDVTTDNAAGRRRLYKVAKVCEAYGQRVQKSVFECTLSPSQFEQFKHRLQQEIDPEQDSLRIYRLREPRTKHLQVLGTELEHDLHEPLII